MQSEDKKKANKVASLLQLCDYTWPLSNWQTSGLVVHPGGNCQGSGPLFGLWDLVLLPRTGANILPHESAEKDIKREKSIFHCRAKRKRPIIFYKKALWSPAFFTNWQSFSSFLLWHCLSASSATHWAKHFFRQIRVSNNFLFICARRNSG